MMPRILIHENCEVFNVACKCGERVVSLYSDDMEGPEIIVDKKGWIYSMDDDVFTPKSTSIDIVARSRCMECGLINRYQFQFRFGVLKSWSNVIKRPGHASRQDTGIKQLVEVQ